MTSNNFEGYEVLSILGTTTYKVQNTDTGKVYLWKAITFEKTSEIEDIVQEIKEQKVCTHQNFVDVYDYIVKKDTGVIYVIAEYLDNSNLNSIIQKCLHENKYLHENFLWKILHQLATILKSSPVTALDLNNVFVGADCNVKVFNYKVQNEMSIGQIVHRLSTLLKNDTFLSYYSNQFKEIVQFTLSPTYSTKEIIDAILCHPILHKLAQVPQIYVQSSEIKALAENESNHEAEDIFQARLKNLRNRERALTAREDKLSFKEHELKKREKKLALMERGVKEKLVHAEVYLKRCREARSSSAGSSKKYENLDSSFSAACESFIEVTSKKLNAEHVKKPSNFTRSLSHHRVQFKGHSPLKEKFGKKCNIDGFDGFKSNVPVKKKLELSKKQLSEQNENVQIEKRALEYRPLSWCEGSKQQAFEMLRIMNDKENKAVQHTYL